jgi:hypothetical protein
MVARQCLIVLPIETELADGALTNLLDSIDVCVGEILTLGDCDLADGNSCMKLVAALMRMGNLNETGENISLPCLVQWVVEVLDVPLEQPQLSLEADGVGLQLCNLALNAVVSSFQGIVGGVESLKPLGVSFSIHEEYSCTREGC